MESLKIEEALDQSLQMMREGATIDQCVSRYPDHAEELRAQLGTAQDLMKARPHVAPRNAARVQGRARLMAAVAERREAAAVGGGQGLLTAVQAFLAGAFWKAPAAVARAAPAALAVLILGGAAWGVSAATGNPNPGNWFATESSSEQIVEVRGAITAINSDLLTIDTGMGLTLLKVTAQTQFEGQGPSLISLTSFGVGDLVKASGVLDEDGTLIAKELEMEHDSTPVDLSGVDDDDSQGDVDEDQDSGDAQTPIATPADDDDNGDIDDGAHEDVDDGSESDYEDDGYEGDGYEDDNHEAAPDNTQGAEDDGHEADDGGESDDEHHDEEPSHEEDSHDDGGED